MNICNIEGCESPIKACGLCSRHYERHRTGKVVNGDTNRKRGTGTITTQGYFSMGRELVHRMIAAIALGRVLKSKEVVHHLDGNTLNNTNSNLVVCNKDYHALLHRRQKSFDMSGHYDWVRCQICGCYDNPNSPDMWVSTRNEAIGQHRSCGAARQQARRKGVDYASQSA